jgi:glucokinase
LVSLDDGRVVVRSVRPTRPERGGEAVLADVVELARSLQEEAERLQLDPASIGIGLCELVSPNGQILSEATIRWRDISAATQIQQKTRLPVLIDADVRAAARAEAHFGAGRNSRLFLYITVGTGISAALVMDKRPHVGARGLTGTFASSPGLIPDMGGQIHEGPPLEEFSAGPALASRYAVLQPDFSGAAPDVVTLAESGEVHAQNVVRSAGVALGAAIAQLVNVLDPEAIVIGGGLGLAEGLYRRSVISSLRSHVWSELHRDIQLIPAQLANDAGIIGAALATLYR